jgi:hypothetical protein
MRPYILQCKVIDATFADFELVVFFLRYLLDPLVNQ